MSRNRFFEGAKQSVPIMLGYVPLGLAFGIIAREKGLSVLEAALMSFAAFTGSGQFIAVGMLGAGAGVPAILITNLLINLRYMLYSASMAPYVSKMPTYIQSLFAFQISDETFAMNMAAFQKQGADKQFIFGVNVFSHFSWIVNSAIGAALGNMIPDINRYGVNYALPAMFIALLIMQIKDKTAMLVAGLSALISLVILISGGTNSNVIIATVISATMGVIICRQKQKSTSSS